MKTWNTPAIEELDINKTEKGGHFKTSNDGFYTTNDLGEILAGQTYISGLDHDLF